MVNPETLRCLQSHTSSLISADVSNSQPPSCIYSLDSNHSLSGLALTLGHYVCPWNMITPRDWIKVTDCIIRQVSPHSLQRLKAHSYNAREQRRCKSSISSSISSCVCLGFFPPPVISGTAPQSVILLLCSCLFLWISPSRPPSALIWDQQGLTSRAVSGVFLRSPLCGEGFP